CAGHTQAVRAVDFSPDRKLAASGSVDRTIKLWEAATGREAQTLNGHEDSIWAVTFSPDGTQLLSGGEDQTLKLWDVATGQERRTFHGHNGVVVAAALSSDGKTVLSGSLDGTMRLWETDTGKAIAMLVGFRDGEWIIMTPEGYYTASEHGDEHMIARVGSRVYGLNRFRATFYKPAVVEAAIRLGSSAQGIARVLGGAQPAHTVTALQELEPPSVALSSPANGVTLDQPTPVLAVHVEARRRPIRTVQVYVNGERQAGPDVSALLPAAGAAIKTGASPAGSPSLDLKIPLRLEPGENLVEVVASNGYAEQRDALRLTVAPPKGQSVEWRKPDLWMLAVGVNGYQDDKIPPLPYAGQDAEALVQAFMKQRGKVFRDVHAFVLSEMGAAQPTGENIRAGLSRLEQAKPGDLVLVFLAGHGMEDERGEFLFLPKDASLTAGGAGVSGAVSWREWQALLDLPAKKLFFADTCYWESIGEHRARGVDNEQLAKDLQEFNAVSYTSCRGTERAVEQEAWSNGALVKALVHGLRGKADLSRDRIVTLNELDTYITDAVPLLTNGAQYPVTNTPEGYQQVPIALLD
ncbi:MAG: caspase family protein, partial [Nitrospiraceae bacterium]